MLSRASALGRVDGLEKIDARTDRLGDRAGGRVELTAGDPVDQRLSAGAAGAALRKAGWWQAARAAFTHAPDPDVPEHASSGRVTSGAA